MIAIDTNVLVRFVAQDDPAQSPQATKLIREALARGDTVFVSGVVLAETVWVLKSYYRLPRHAIALMLEALLGAPGFEVEAAVEAAAALQNYRALQGDYVDYLIGHLADSRKSGPVYTFDQGLKSSRLFRVLSSGRASR